MTGLTEIQSIDAPASANAGDTVTVTYRVKNISGGQRDIAGGAHLRSGSGMDLGYADSIPETLLLARSTSGIFTVSFPMHRDGITAVLFTYINLGEDDWDAGDRRTISIDATPDKIVTEFLMYEMDQDTVNVGDRVAVGCTLVEEVSGIPIANALISFVDSTIGDTIFQQRTNSEGYMSRYWYPDASRVGSHEYYVTWNGSSKYLLKSSTTKTLVVIGETPPLPAGEIKIVGMSYG